MRLEKEDYLDPMCVLCGKPGEPEMRQTVPVDRVMDRLHQLEEKNDREGIIRHLTYWLAEAESLGDRRAQLTLNNELMGQYRMRGDGEKARGHAEKALALIESLEMEDTVTAGTTCLNAATVREAFGDPVGAMALFERARENYEKNLPASDARLGGLYNNMALACQALGRFPEAFDLYEKAMTVMQDVAGGVLEQAITCLNMADAVAAQHGLEAGETRIFQLLDQAYDLLQDRSAPRDGYYAFVCEKCAPTFDYYGRFLDARELKQTAEEIYARA
jgi:tetratricopeptide (TPR) repeat protein